MLSSRLLLNIGLVVLIAALAASAYFISQPAATPVLFTRQSAADIDSISIQFNKSKIEIKKQQANWQITQPREIGADDFRIKTILNIVSALPEKFYPVNTTDLGKYALDPPRAVLSLNKLQYQFGSTSAVGDKRYLLFDEKLFLIDDTFFPLITAGYKNLMRRQLMPAETKINEISFAKTRLVKNKKGSWQLSNDKNQTSADQIKHFIDNWLHIQAYAVVEVSPPYHGTKVSVITDKGNYAFVISKSDSNTTVINTELGLSYQFDISVHDSLLDLAHFAEQ